MWQNTPVEQFKGTIFAFEGPVYLTIGLGVPLGVALATIGILRSADSGIHRIWPVVTGLVLIALGMVLFPPTPPYFPVLFDVASGLILVFFFAAIWYWGKNRSMLEGPTKSAADYQLLSYMSFLFAAFLVCALLGNPFSGLYFPEKVIEQNALPYHYSFGIQAAMYFVLGWFFTFLNHYKPEHRT